MKFPDFADEQNLYLKSTEDSAERAHGKSAQYEVNMQNSAKK